MSSLGALHPLRRAEWQLRPFAVKMMELMSDPIEGALQTYVDAGTLAGASTLVWQRSHSERHTHVGVADLHTGQPVARNTIFRVASMTKPVTTIAALILLEEGRVALDEPIDRHAPEFADICVLRSPNGTLGDSERAVRPITFRDLLTHRAGFTYGDFHRGPVGNAYTDRLGPNIDNDLDPDEWLSRLASVPLIDQPGAGFHYGHSTDVLGFLIARIEGKSLGRVLSQRIFEPLGMRDTGFDVPVDLRHRRAGLCGFDDEGRLKPLAAAPGRHAVADRPGHMTFQSGGQGLWSTVDDYVTFARLFVGQGAVDGVRLLKPETISMMTSNQLTAEQRVGTRMLGRAVFAAGHGYGMGVAVVMEPDKADPLRCRGSVGTVGWPGAYGGWWQADPGAECVMVFLAHNMLELHQMAIGVGLGVWSAIARFHALAFTLPDQ